MGEPTACRTRPETHQNLIHTDKEQHRRRNGDQHEHRCSLAGEQTTSRSHDLSVIQHPGTHPSQDNPTRGNPGYGDYRVRTGDPLLAKQVLYQLS